MKLQSLRRRSLTDMLVTTLTALVLTCAALLTYELIASKRTMTRNLSILAKTVAANCTAPLVYDNQKVAQEALSALKFEPEIVSGCLFDKSGHVYCTYPANTPPNILPLATSPDGLHFVGLSLIVFQPVIEAGGRVGTLFIREDLGGMYNRFGVYAAVVLLAMATSASVAFLLSRVYQRRISQPILDLAAVARQISERGDFSVRAEETAAVEELWLLNHAFNEMLNQIHIRDFSLEQGRQALETRVAERTHSLEETTNQLYDFCYSIAHDLKAPIRSQSGYARILVQDFAKQLGSEGTIYAQRIADAADRQTRLVSDLLAHVGLGRSEMPLEAVELGTIAEQVRSDLRSEIERQQAMLDLSGIHGSVLANSASLNLILINLFSNALKFVPRNRVPQLKAWTEIRGEFVRIWVEDNGIGISAQHLNKLFMMFQRLHTREEYPGTGIGLAIVKRAAERMDGAVGVESEERKGSRFWVDLRRPSPAQSSSAN